MVGTAAPVMKKYIPHPAKWVAKNKLKSLLGKPVCIDDIPKCDVGQDPRQGDLRETGGGNVQVMRRIEPVKLSEAELADMLRTD
jgi:hypothetical protein